MDPATPYYYALSTIAQCAAALAALIGFLSLWWWDRLRERMERANWQLSAVRYTEQLKASEAREAALKREQQQLLRALYRFLLLTLAILVVAIVLILLADMLCAYIWTAWALKGGIILMSLGLGVGPFFMVCMVRKAVSSVGTVGLLVLILLASPALAGPVRCTTYEEKSLGRYWPYNRSPSTAERSSLCRSPC